MKKIFFTFVFAFLIIVPFIGMGVYADNASVTPSGAPGESAVARLQHKDFIISEAVIRAVLKQEELKTRELTIRNTADDDIEVIVQNEIGFLSTENNISIKKGQEKTIFLNFLPNETGVFTNTLILKSSSLIKELPVVAEVESQEVSADIRIDASTRYKEVLAGEQVVADVLVSNFIEEKKEFSISYKILDMRNSNILMQNENIEVLKNAEFRKSISLPSYLKEGDYILAAEVSYENSVGTSSFLFHVREENKQAVISYLKDYRLYILVAAISLIIVIFFFMNYRALKNIENMRSPIRVYNMFKKEETLANAQDAARRLERQKQALESAFRAGYIHEKSYRAVRKRIDKMLNEIGKKLKKGK